MSRFPKFWAAGPFRSVTTSTALALLRDHSLLLLRHCTRQLDYVASQRIKRTSSLIGLYSKLWDREKLRQVLESAGKRIFRRQYRLLLGLTALSPAFGHSKSEYDWKNIRLPNEFMLNHKEDVSYAHHLTRETLTCQKCEKRHLIENKEPGVEYCNCEDKKSRVYGVHSAKKDIPWVPFLEKKDIIVWRRPHPDHNGLFIYLMYGKFDDVTANEFLEVQLDLSEFRLTWDHNSAQCNVLEEEVETDQNSISQIYYWEVNWPRFFSNRDYVCNRRSQIFADDNVGVVYSKAATHASAPKKSKNFRVEDYWSILCVKPFSEKWDEKGLEFSLIAFENPGVSLPASITTWVAMRGMPEFMNNLRKACGELRKNKKKEKKVAGKKKLTDDSLLPRISAKTKSQSEISKTETNNNNYDHLYSKNLNL